MWLVLALCVNTVTATFIQLRDRNFDGEDQQLQRLLRQRMQGSLRDAADLPIWSDPELEKHLQDRVAYTLQMFELEMNEREELVNGSRRQVKQPVQIQQPNLNDTRKPLDQEIILALSVPQNYSGRRQSYWRFPKEPTVRDLKERNMEMMQHQIYAVQYRMRDLQKIIDKYSGDLNYRVAYIFCRLETLLQEMHVIYSYMRKTDRKNVLHTHMIYYTYMLKKNVDVTYIVEYMIRIHTEYLEGLRKLKKKPNLEKIKNLLATTPGIEDGPRPEGPGDPDAEHDAGPPPPGHEAEQAPPGIEGQPPVLGPGGQQPGIGPGTGGQQPGLPGGISLPEGKSPDMYGLPPDFQIEDLFDSD